MDNPFKSYTPYVGQGTPGPVQFELPDVADVSTGYINPPSSEYLGSAPTSLDRVEVPNQAFNAPVKVSPQTQALQGMSPKASPSSDISQLYPQSKSPYAATQTVYGAQPEQSQLERCQAQGNCQDLYKMMEEQQVQRVQREQVQKETEPACGKGFVRNLSVILFVIFGLSMLIISIAYNRLGPVVNIISDITMFIYVVIVAVLIIALVSKVRCNTAWILAAAALTLQVFWMLWVVVWA